MYETYSNVDDPDGFYGIKNLDVRDALNRRLQHEGEHHRSLGLHAAALESGLQSISGRSNALLVMKDMHHLGFNQLSNAVFGQVKSVDQQNASTPSDPLIFELAWRTGDWDLPLPKGDDVSSEARLYAALRAVHRERDPNAAAVVVQEGIGAEVARLKDLGMERTGQVKKAVVDLLCLREVDRWLTLGTSANRTDPSQMTYLTELDSAYS
jgi:ataxia telangiectasia mutated family protein